MTNLEMMRRAVESGDATAYLALADSLADKDDPRAEELSALANNIAHETDWAVVALSMDLFEELYLNHRP